jgi:hypothetical protein
MHGTVYGSGAGRQILKNVRTSRDLPIGDLDENVPVEHEMKVGAILGAFFGFHGGTEHTNMLVEHLEVGVFELGHQLEGSDFYGLAPKEDKSMKLTTTNTILPWSEYTRIPIGDRTHPSSPGGTIYCYLKKLAPGQKRFYCKVTTDPEKAKFRQQGFPDAVYSPLRPHGLNAITVLLGAAARKLG